MDKNIHCYDDIIELAHPTSHNHPRMSLYDRAAQFSPFSALTGLDEAVRETSRLTDRKIEWDEYILDRLNKEIAAIKENLGNKQEITVTYFRPDAKKAGGAYVTHTGSLRKIDEYHRVMIMDDKTEIPMEQISDISRR